MGIWDGSNENILYQQYSRIITNLSFYWTFNRNWSYKIQSFRFLDSSRNRVRWANAIFRLALMAMVFLSGLSLICIQQSNQLVSASHFRIEPFCLPKRTHNFWAVIQHFLFSTFLSPFGFTVILCISFLICLSGPLCVCLLCACVFIYSIVYNITLSICNALTTKLCVLTSFVWCVRSFIGSSFCLLSFFLSLSLRPYRTICMDSFLWVRTNAGTHAVNCCVRFVLWNFVHWGDMRALWRDFRDEFV